MGVTHAVWEQVLAARPGTGAELSAFPSCFHVPFSLLHVSSLETQCSFPEETVHQAEHLLARKCSLGSFTHLCAVKHQVVVCL